MLTLADSHMHLFRNGFASRHGSSAAGSLNEVDAYEALRRAHNITEALVVGYEDDGIDPTNNDYLRTLAGTRSWMSTVAYVRPTEAPGPSRIEQLLAAGHCGISLYLLSADAAQAVEAWSWEVWRLLEDSRAIVSLNAARGALGSVSLLARSHEACSFAISHLGDPGNHRDVPTTAAATEQLAPLLEMAALPNTYVKISGLYAVSDPPYGYPHPQATPFVDLVLCAFGHHRCMWGSDFSPSLEHVSFEQTVNLLQLSGLAEAEYARVMGGTLLDLLNTARSR